MRLPGLSRDDSSVSDRLVGHPLAADLFGLESHVFVAGDALAGRQPRGGEYLHADFGTVTSTLLLNPATQCSPAGPCGLSWSRQVKQDIVRFGVSYKFGGPSAVVAKY